jgi:hypothetical protein
MVLLTTFPSSNQPRGEQISASRIIWSGWHAGQCVRLHEPVELWNMLLEFSKHEKAPISGPDWSTDTLSGAARRDKSIVAIAQCQNDSLRNCLLAWVWVGIDIRYGGIRHAILKSKTKMGC